MNEDKEYGYRFIQLSKVALPFLYGVIMALFIIAAAGDLALYSSFDNFYLGPLGWYSLWLLTTVFSITAGIVTLAGRDWRKLPITQRRGTVMGYLVAGLINWLSMGLRSSWSNLFWPPAVLHGLVLLVVYYRIFRLEDSKKDLFP